MIYVFTGDNDYLINFEVNKLVEELKKNTINLEVEKLEGEEINVQRLKEILNTLSIFSTKRIIIINDIDKIKNIGESIKEITENFDENIEFIIILKDIDKRLSIYSNLKKEKNFREINKLKTHELKDWAREYLSAFNVKIDSNDLIFLIDRIGDDQFMLKNELDKLMLISKNITREDIYQLSEASINSKIFDLLNSAFEGNKKNTIKLYEEQIYSKVDPNYILAMITWQLTNLAFVIFGKNIPQEELVKISKISPYTISNSRKLLDKIDQDKLKNLISNLSDIDYKTKTSSMSLDEALKNFLLTIS